ncbi:flavodoxin domain-containing protein [Azospirillum isscasi]|uniref:Flavodoxin domain-containing protein n=1 Tax=Azospirillum isscasi TaxID=3053926 RepID=A0ABU0WFI9_9PROT|nr:flavodoxin domain-containing protein [Azospirillum isscasi]MDQ2102818.1 flavodoxin domain-containing protein [Azospirillum isscasi]
MAEILIVVGSESGNAHLVAECVRDALARAGHGATLSTGQGCADLRLPDRGVLLVCTSTHGHGDWPDNIAPFVRSLDETRPDLSRLRYGVIALGDRTYRDTFCLAGRRLDEALRRLSATRLGERLEIDACQQPLPDEDALAWLESWTALLNAPAAHHNENNQHEETRRRCPS